MAKGWRQEHQEILDFMIRKGVGKWIPRAEFLAELNPQLNSRRIRELRDFRYEVDYRAKNHEYCLMCATPNGTPKDAAVSGKLRAQALQAAHGRCQMCGRTVAEDHVRLEVDHRTPKSWGGKSEIGNLWAICSDCNNGKRNFFASLPQDIMQKVMKYDNIHVRIGEMLKAFKGKVTPRALLEVAGKNQDDWPKRLRQLRLLGWKIEQVNDSSQEGKYRKAYKLVADKPWPENPSAVIGRLDKKSTRGDVGDEPDGD